MGITCKTLQLNAPWLASSAPSCSSPPLLPLFHSLKTLLLPQQQLQQQHLQLQLQQQLLAPVLLLQQLQHLQQLLQRQQQQQLLPQEGRVALQCGQLVSAIWFLGYSEDLGKQNIVLLIQTSVI